jgi:hypothetical protein
MEDMPEAERRALEEEMAKARRRKLACFQKTHMGVIKKPVLAITTMATATPTVSPNLTPKELVKFMDVAVSSNYGNDLTNFTRTITEEVCNTRHLQNRSIKHIASANYIGCAAGSW